MPTAYLGGLDFVLRERIAEALSSEARISTSWPSLPCRGREHMPTRESSTVSHRKGVRFADLAQRGAVAVVGLPPCR
jgi:hypothetical protein